MLPQDDKYGTWPASGEIDVMEAKGHEPDQVLGTLHYGARWPNNSNTGKHCEFPAGGTISHFHVYALEWEPGKISWFVDGKVCLTQSFWWSSSRLDGDKGAKPGHELELNPWPAPFDHPFYIVMNVAVGGQFLGSPDKTTRFPAEMVIDYVRVYDKVGGYGVPRARGEGRLPFDKP
jgi:beta-glucanase (GH16 family)